MYYALRGSVWSRDDEIMSYPMPPLVLLAFRRMPGRTEGDRGLTRQKYMPVSCTRLAQYNEGERWNIMK